MPLQGEGELIQSPALGNLAQCWGNAGLSGRPLQADCECDIKLESVIKLQPEIRYDPIGFIYSNFLVTAQIHALLNSKNVEHRRCPKSLPKTDRTLFSQPRNIFRTK